MAPSLISIAVGALRLLLLKFLSDAPYKFNDSILPQHEYDFVVVGAGSAGSVVASRLAEAGASVLLLEAGDSAPPESAVPGLVPLVVASDADYNLKLASQKNAQQAFANNASFLALGRVMGGGSTINGMVYTRGDKMDFDHWASLGNEGWDYESVLYYFKKLEDFRGYRKSTTDKFRGSGGPFRVSAYRHPSSLAKAFFKGGQELGYDIIDEDGPSRIGFTPQHFSVRDGYRGSASESYLRPVVRRKNIFVLTNAVVTKVFINSRKRATGVQFTFRNKVYSVRARKEVILSAGTIHTPKLLMLSGVGPRRHLNELGIPVVVPLEGVGRNLQDHFCVVYLPFEVNREMTTNSKVFTDPSSLKAYVRNRTGVFSKAFGSLGAAFVSLGEGEPSSWPDVQISLIEAPVASILGYIGPQRTHDLTKETYDSLPASFLGPGSVLMVPGLLRPRSRGTVTLTSSDHNQTPLVDYNFFSDPHDLKLLIDAIKFTIVISQTEAMKGVGATFKAPELYGCTHLPLESEPYWQCVVRRLVTTFYHPVGTCKMAPPSDPMGVVSSRLLVHGVSGLRVIDGSIMPTINGGNTMGTVIMIGEKAADMIKQDWNI